MRILAVVTVLSLLLGPASATDLVVDLGSARDFDRRFDAEVSRIGFDVRPQASRPWCTKSGVALSCNMRIGSMGVVVGTSEDEKVKDLMLVRAGGAEEGVAWINTMTTFIAMFEPRAEPIAIRNALAALYAPMVDEAIDREKQLKGWNRAWKIRLIERSNPDRVDVAGDVPYA